MRRVGVIVAGLALFLVSTGTAAAGEKTHDLRLAVFVVGSGDIGEPCGYDAVGRTPFGSQVIIRNEKGTTLATRTIREGTIERFVQRQVCALHYRFKKLPDAKFYRFKIGTAGALEVSRAQLAKKHWRIELDA